MLLVVACLLAAIVVLGTALSLLRARVWWVRMWDFPRLQVAALGVLALGLWWRADEPAGWRRAGFALLGAAVLYQATRIWRYTRLAPREVQRARLDEPARRLCLVVCNVLQSNREADRLLQVVGETDADLVLLVETDAWWAERLAPLARTHPHVVSEPRENTYGMLLYSRLPLEGARLAHLIEPDIPSVHCDVVLRDGTRVRVHCVHPRPPAPGESDESLERDAELLHVARTVRDEEPGMPVVVLGDLNDVAWSRTTRLFQKVSRLLDPRKGRGFIPTFHAGLPGLRWPLDHVFHSDHFRLVTMRRLPSVGSDHFPVYVALSHEPAAKAEQEAPAADHADLVEAQETVEEARAESGIGARAGATA